MNKARAVCLNCIDGRVQIPVIHWIQEQCDVDYVDMITEPGMDGLLADIDCSIEEIIKKIQLSIELNNAQTIIVAGHDDCRGNFVSEAEHKQHVQQAVGRLKESFSDIPILGLWMNSEFQGEIIEK